jgi:ATP-dependent helicase/nuclease subunit B
LRLLDVASAPYADLDELHLIGLVEGDWPEPIRRSIFYPAAILADLGWPREGSRMPAARAAFRDLLTSAGARVSLSLFTLEGDSIVAPSPLLEELETAGLITERQPPLPAVRAFVHEALQAGEDAGEEALPPQTPSGAEAWLALRVSRGGTADDERFKGSTGPRLPQVYAVSALERYLECPFKYFAGRVLRLPEERDEESGLTALERGQFVHEVFERFFREWHRQGGRAIRRDNVAEALELFESIAERQLEKLTEGDRALERTHLLGSAVSSGLAERAFAFEMEAGGEIVERLLEYELEGTFTLAGSSGPRQVRIRAKADRLDLLADGTIRVIDYKTGRAPKAARALQLPIYGVIAEQALRGFSGRDWTVASAGYIAFKEKEPFVALGAGRSGGLATAVAEGQQRLLDAIDGIERGEFPVDPDEPYRCQWCAYAGVCRKDYVGDE